MRALICIALSIHLLVGTARVCVAGTVDVRSDGGILWLDSRAAPAEVVFAGIARETGIRFVVGEELRSVPVSFRVEGVGAERAVRNLIGQLEAVGYTMSYESLPAGGARLAEVAIYGEGGRSGKETVYEAERASMQSVLAPNHEELAEALKAGGVPEDSIKRVVALSRALEAERSRIAATSPAGGDLSPDSAESLERLIAMGMSMEEAVRAVLIQEQERKVMQEIATIPGGSHVFQMLRRRSYIEYDE
ncbi:MAG: hypothetical protein ACREQ9_18715 [Candidatus Binatia bacterium]